MAKFIPRTVFSASADTPRSYFLGHHRAGLKDMQSALNSIDLVIECRDYRIPISSRNPLLETSLAGKERVIVYTKSDLVSHKDFPHQDTIRRWHAPTPVVLSQANLPAGGGHAVLKEIRRRAKALDTLTSARMMVVGMPNVGKSSLLNKLRRVGIDKGTAAITGGQPGVTRGVHGEVRIFGSPKDTDAIYLVDTPGVFIPYISDAETMLKLALCGCVKDSIIPFPVLADYLLFKLNLTNPKLYRKYSKPTNEIDDFLQQTAQYTGMLTAGGGFEPNNVAMWLVQQWRKGKLGSIMLDTVDENSLQEKIAAEKEASPSYSQAMKAAKQEVKEKRQMKVQAKATLSMPT